MLYSNLYKMLIRYNFLKIFIQASDAKPGGNIGAMLAPYLYAANLNEFCKKFNELTKDYMSEIWLAINLYCDSIERVYTFNIKVMTFSMFVLDYIYIYGKRLNINFLYDLITYHAYQYKLTIRESTLIIFSLLKTFRRRKKVINFAINFYDKVVSELINNV